MSTRLTSDEEELARLISQGDPEAFRALFVAYFPILCRYAEKYLGDTTLAEDVVQETFIKVWKNRGTYPTAPELKGFLYTVTRNGCLNVLRSRMREEQRHKVAAAAQEEDDIAGLEHLAAIYVQVAGMPAKMREVFLLSFEQGLSIGQIAQKMDISEKTVRNQKYKSLQLLRRRLGGQTLLYFF
ncbi:MAG TPA: RNA polymerase sigma-70 factor [Dinghuibacter sp.]|uniref:RNA polymerase sigma factor n=1 Tax=Dinghuibacter sp. TaxID=2024697 RepID=UPI002CB5C3BE|nr:RNA polymerase sigma-70 factor [Dinghuibacter sp.]HTJ11907.1 RNA polymerase sigma-70 factor [Dinghuibacter sp.]